METEVVNTNLSTRTSHRWMAGEKRQESSVSHESGEGWYVRGRAAKVKSRPELPPQDPGGRFLGTYAQGPSGNDV